MTNAKHLIAFAAAAAALSSLSSSSLAVQQPSYLPPAGMLEVASGAAARQVRQVTGRSVPRSAQPAWTRFQRAVGGRHLAIWDDATGVPLRIFGTGIPAPGALADPLAAERHARTVLEQHLPLLAPGCRLADFVLVTNELYRGTRSVAYAQQHHGLEVLGGQVSFRFKSDRLIVIGSEARPHVAAAPPAVTISAETAQKIALGWLAELGPAVSHVAGAVQGPLILPLIGDRAVLGYRTVMRVVVSVSSGPPARWSVYLDAATGERVAREQTLQFAEATLRYNTPVRYPGGERLDDPAANADLTVNGQSAASTAEGIVTFTDEPAVVLATPQGAFVGVTSFTGAQASEAFTLTAGSTAVWDAQDDHEVDAQLTGFIHAQKAQELGRTMAPNLSWLDSHLPVNVNRTEESCNAFYDGFAINFYAAVWPCENTARLPDVIYHEFGHGFHHHAIVPGIGAMESALSEGLSDYFAAAMTGDPKMGIGMYHTTEPLRDLDPNQIEHVWPDDIDLDPHATGLIIGGALWDLRKELQSKHGDEAGAALTNALYYDAMRGAVDIPSMWAELLRADDDDGDLANGTPNICEISYALGRHGLRPLSIESVLPSVEPAGQDHRVELRFGGLYPQCEGDVITPTIRWQLRRTPYLQQTVAMTGGPEQFTGDIPAQPAGEVVQYRVEISLADGSSIAFPENQADPYYELFVGEVEPLYCTDFESDPFVDGWTHGLRPGWSGDDDWQWGAPTESFPSGDPAAAFSGNYVLGNDLGHGAYDGLYLPNRVSFAATPVVDVGDYKNVRLQYRRWLNVEDGYYYDRATILANGQQVWTSYASSSFWDAWVHHQDRIWRFHDVDLSQHIDATTRTVQVEFELGSGDKFELGGWNLDDVCIVGFADPSSGACGDGLLDPGEECDDGNALPGDGCDPLCRQEPEPEEVEPTATVAELIPSGGCACRLTAAPSRRGFSLGWIAIWLALAAWRRRRGACRATAGTTATSRGQQRRRRPRLPSRIACPSRLPSCSREPRMPATVMK